MVEGNYIRVILISQFLFGSRIYGHRIADGRAPCLKIKQTINPIKYSLEYITAAVGEDIVQAPPSDGFFLPESPRSISLKAFNITHASLQWTPSSAGLQNLRYYLLQITEEADGPKMYISYILINISTTNIIQKDSLFNYTCIRIYPDVYRVFVKVWALSGDVNGSNVTSIYKKGKFSSKMSNYLPVPNKRDTATEKALHDQNLQTSQHRTRPTKRHKKREGERDRRIRHKFKKIKADCPL